MKPLSQLSDTDFEQLARRAAALPDAPQAWVERACALFAQPSAAGQVAGAALALVRAVLSFDSWAPVPAGMAVRALPSQTRHLVFSTLGRDIDLRIVPTSGHSGHFAVSGQILGPDESGRVELTALPDGAVLATSPPRSVALDAMGEFRLDRVPGGWYQLTLHLSGELVQLPPLQVGAQRP